MPDGKKEGAGPGFEDGSDAGKPLRGGVVKADRVGVEQRSHPVLVPGAPIEQTAEREPIQTPADPDE